MITVSTEMTRLLRKMKSLQDALDPKAIATHHMATTTGYLKNRALSRFESEGDDASGKWLPLAPYTVQDRAQRGFPASNPIMRRTGSLRKWVMDSPGVASAETFMWPAQMPPNNSSLMFAYAGAQMGRSNMPRRRIVVINMRDFLTVRELLQHRIWVALNA